MTPIQIEPFKIYKEDPKLEWIKKSGLGIFLIGVFFLLISLTGTAMIMPNLFLFLSFGLSIIGAVIYSLPVIWEAPAGIKNNKIFFNSFTSRGAIAWIVGIIITAFYFSLYWFPAFIENWIRLVDPLSYFLRGEKADRWFLYGTFYTLAVLFMGLKMIIKYRHNRYHIIRTFSVMFFQLGFAYMIPALLIMFNKPEHYFSYFWPLKYQYLFPTDIHYLTSTSGALGYFMVFWGAAMTFIAVPVLSYFFGKRWYCSWVCGCGGLAETAGDPFRHLSDKSLKSWKIERWSIHSVLVFVIVNYCSALDKFCNRRKNSRKSFTNLFICLWIFNRCCFFRNSRSRFLSFDGKPSLVQISVVHWLQRWDSFKDSNLDSESQPTVDNVFPAGIVQHIAKWELM